MRNEMLGCPQTGVPHGRNAELGVKKQAVGGGVRTGGQRDRVILLSQTCSGPLGFDHLSRKDSYHKLPMWGAVPTGRSPRR